MRVRYDNLNLKFKRKWESSCNDLRRKIENSFIVVRALMEDEGRRRWPARRGCRKAGCWQGGPAGLQVFRPRRRDGSSLGIRFSSEGDTEGCAATVWWQHVDRLCREVAGCGTAGRTVRGDCEAAGTVDDEGTSSGGRRLLGGTPDSRRKRPGREDRPAADFCRLAINAAVQPAGDVVRRRNAAGGGRGGRLTTWQGDGGPETSLGCGRSSAARRMSSAETGQPAVKLKSRLCRADSVEAGQRGMAEDVGKRAGDLVEAAEQQLVAGRLRRAAAKSGQQPRWPAGAWAQGAAAFRREEAAAISGTRRRRACFRCGRRRRSCRW